MGEAAVVAVGDGDELTPGTWTAAGVDLALDSGADEGELDVVVGGDRLGVLFQFGFGGGKNMQTGHESGCRYGSGSP